MAIIKKAKKYIARLTVLATSINGIVKSSTISATITKLESV